MNLDKALRHEIRAAAKTRILTALPYCFGVMLIYIIPTMILGMVVQVPLDAEWPQMLRILGVTLVFEIVVLGPIMMGVQFALLGVARDEKPYLGIVFSPLGDVHGLLRGIRMMLCMVTRLILLAAVPTGLYMGAAYFIARWLDGYGVQDPQIVHTVILILLFVYFMMLLPIMGHMLSYSLGYAFLRDNPKMGVWQATAEGSRLLRGNRRGMLLLVLSFVPWFAGGLLTFGLLSMFGSAYMSVSAYTLGDRLRAAHPPAVVQEDDAAP